MRHPFVRALAALLLVSLAAAPSWSGTLQLWEDTLGAPGVTAQFDQGSGLIADIDFDASSAETGQLPEGGPSDIIIQPTGNVVFVAFTCQLTGCSGADFVFTAGGDGVGELRVSDPNSVNPETGIFDIGLLEFDIASGFGTVELVTCNYFSDTERTCDPFTLVSVPEPTSAALLACGLGSFAIARRRRA